MFSNHILQNLKGRILKQLKFFGWKIDQFRYTKIQPKLIDLGMRLYE